MRAFLLTSLSVAILLGPAAEAAAPPAGAIVALREGVRLKKENRLQDAISKLEQATQLAPNYVEAWTELGNTHLARQAYGPAAASFTRAVKLKPDHAVARYNLAFSLRKLNRHTEAAEQYRLYLQQKPDDPDAHYGLAEALRSAGDNLAAAEAYEAYARTEKDPAQRKWVDKAKETAARLRREAGTKKAAAPALAKAPAVEKKAGEKLHLSFAGSGRKKAAKEPPRKSKTPPKDAPTKNGHRPEAFRAGLTQLQGGDYAAALPRLQTALRQMPEDSLILAAVAGAHLGLDQAEQAEAAYVAAIRTASNDALPGLYLGLGEAQRMQGKDAEARVAYQKALGHARASNSIKRFSRERMAALDAE